jgi:hypothetical protein
MTAFSSAAVQAVEAADPQGDDADEDGPAQPAIATRINRTVAQAHIPFFICFLSSLIFPIRQLVTFTRRTPPTLLPPKTLVQFERTTAGGMAAAVGGHTRQRLPRDYRLYL